MVFAPTNVLPFEDDPKSETQSDAKAAFEFRKLEYFHRYSKDHLHEFTPQGQEDLEKWDDMITFNRPEFMDSEEKLADWANRVLNSYQAARGSILRTKSIPKTADQPAEHFIAVLFVRGDFAECAFARFKMQDGKGINVVYSRRFRSDQLIDDVKSRLKEHGAEVEKALMQWNPFPVPAPLEKR